MLELISGSLFLRNLVFFEPWIHKSGNVQQTLGYGILIFCLHVGQHFGFN